MKLFTITSGLLGLALAIAQVAADDVTYSVIAFPGTNGNVSVSVGGQDYLLSQSPLNANLFTGTAPFGYGYRYVMSMMDKKAGATRAAETNARSLSDGVSLTGNEFFNRSRTVYDVPALPRAYNPIYPALQSNMSRDNEISTILLNADMTAINAILTKPLADHSYAEIYNMSYISHDVVYNFRGAGIKNSGQSTKDLAKQSLQIQFNKFNNATNDTIFGRQAFKLRAEATDPSMTREKFMFDALTAAGAATTQGNWVRLIVNGEPFGLYLMTDDSFTGFTDNFYNGGSKMKSTGVTIKGNAMSDTQEANLVYKGPSNQSYDFSDVYILEDEGRDPTITKDSYSAPLINFMYRLNHTTIGSDDQTPGNITDLMDSADHTMIQIAMSFLSGSWDGFWYQASNYFLTENTDTQKWYLMSNDFDETFGNDLENMALMTAPYTNYSRPGSQRPLANMFVKSPYYEPRFQDILKTIVKRFFNPRVVKPHLDAWMEMLKEDVAWDRSLAFRSPGQKIQFTAGDLNNIYSTVRTSSGSTIGLLEWVSNRTTSLCQQLNFTDTDDLLALPDY